MITYTIDQGNLVSIFPSRKEAEQQDEVQAIFSSLNGLFKAVDDEKVWPNSRLVEIYNGMLGGPNFEGVKPVTRLGSRRVAVIRLWTLVQRLRRDWGATR